MEERLKNSTFFLTAYVKMEEQSSNSSSICKWCKSTLNLFSTHKTPNEYCYTNVHLTHHTFLGNTNRTSLPPPRWVSRIPCQRLPWMCLLGARVVKSKTTACAQACNLGIKQSSYWILRFLLSTYYLVLFPHHKSLCLLHLSFLPLHIQFHFSIYLFLLCHDFL